MSEWTNPLPPDCGLFYGRPLLNNNNRKFKKALNIFDNVYLFNQFLSGAMGFNSILRSVKM